METGSRRRFLRLVGVGAMAGFAGCSQSDGGSTATDTETVTEAGASPTGTPTETPTPTEASASSGRFEQFQGDPAHSGQLPDAGAPTGGVETAWTADVGDGIALGAGIADGTVIAPSSETSLAAYSLSDGSTLWEYEAENPVQGFPSISGDTVFVGTGELYEEGGKLVAVSIADGGERWAVEEGKYGILPTITEELALFSSGSGGTVYAVSKTDGAVAWRFSPETDVTLGVTALADGVVYATTDSGTLYALDVADGTVRWSAETGIDTPNLQTVGDLVAMPNNSGDQVFAFERSDGSERWSFENEDVGRGGGAAAPAVTSAGVLFSSGDALHLLDAASGEVEWRAELPSGAYNVTAPVVADGVVYASNGADIRAFELADGTELWRHPVEAFSALSVTEEHVVVCTQSELHVLVKG
jgi:outer membrane protein assembly factor BamB